MASLGSSLLVGRQRQMKSYRQAVHLVSGGTTPSRQLTYRCGLSYCLWKMMSAATWISPASSGAPKPVPPVDPTHQRGAFGSLVTLSGLAPSCAVERHFCLSSRGGAGSPPRSLMGDSCSRFGLPLRRFDRARMACHLLSLTLCCLSPTECSRASASYSSSRTQRKLQSCSSRGGFRTATQPP
jgi:hypothetical protein